jgi:hypothetical protein
MLAATDSTQGDDVVNVVDVGRRDNVSSRMANWSPSR